jgi:cell division transport system ATP-binding protein
MPQIEYQNVTKEYENGLKALEEVSFSVDDGEFIFLVGPSGAGKSTLIKMLIREELPTSGDVLFKGESVLGLDLSQLPGLRRKIGVVFQDFKVLPSKNLYENVAVALEVVNSPDSVIQEVVPNVLGLVGLQDRLESFPSQLSGGELQRLSIARALAHEPDVLIADEPTGMIDPKAGEQVVRILDKINSLGTTVLMATHDYSIVDAQKRRVLRLERGVLKSDKQEGTYHE